jgi:4-hydroxythreonine-4-phosphate dehydrogenase
MGDPAGVGAEIIAKSLGKQGIDAGIYKECIPFVVGDFGSMKSLEKYTDGVNFQRISAVAELAKLPVNTIGVYQPHEDLTGIETGKLSAEAGKAAAAYVHGAVELAKRDEIQGIVTAPLNKAALLMGGDHHPGHTEMLADGFGVKKYAMVLAADGRYIFHVTTHMSLRNAIDSLTVDKVYSRIHLAHLLAQALGQPNDEIAVSGVNPHAGEGGMFGDEEIRIIAPAIEKAKQDGMLAVGPLPADVLFPRMAAGRYNFGVAMYHDQGHAVFKTLYFDTGVNITIGLPVIRTSVDHGTAFDIAGKGIAKADSMIEAIRMAARLGNSWRDISRKAQV